MSTFWQNSQQAVFLFAFLICPSVKADAISSPMLNEAPQAAVVRLYKDYAWMTAPKTAQGARYLTSESVEVLQKYFENTLAKLLNDDFACAQRTAEICNLDFDPMYASQDPQATNLQVSLPNAKGAVQVRFTYPSTGEKIQIEYTMKVTPSGWRVENICYKNRKCLRQILSHHIGEFTGQDSAVPQQSGQNNR